MGVPFAIIIMIILIMGMFAVAGVILYKKRDRFSNHTIDPLPPRQSNHKKE